jgi:hypothetical protein
MKTMEGNRENTFIRDILGVLLQRKVCVYHFLHRQSLEKINKKIEFCKRTTICV